MKKITFLITIILFFTSLNIYAKEKIKINILNLDISCFKNMSLNDFGKFSLGAISSIAIHELGHILYLELNNKNYSLGYSDTKIMIYPKEKLSNKDELWFARSGFLFQNSIGTILSYSKWNKSYFVKGLVSTTTLGLVTCKFINNADFNLINDHTGNGNIEHLIQGCWSLKNTLKIFKAPE